MTGARDLLEIPLSWQKPYIYQCDFTNMICPEPGRAKFTSRTGTLKPL